MAITVEQYQKQVKNNGNFPSFFTEHLEALGIKEKKISSALNVYKRYCSDNGHKNTLVKTDIEFNKERTKRKNRKSTTALETVYHGNDVRKYIEKVLIAKAETRDVYKGEIIESINDLKNNMLREDWDVFLQLLLYLEKPTKLLKIKDYIRSISRLIYHRHNWINDYSDWKPNTHNPHKQFSSLVRFLLCKYEMPKFMDSAWTDGKDSNVNLFLHLASGKNVRKFREIPFPLTKKMAHMFLQAPDHYDIGTAFWWGKVHAMGGDQRTMEALRDTKVIQNKTVEGRTNPQFLDIYNKFKESVIEFFINYPMLDTAHYNPIVDYVWYVRYEPRTEFIERGVAVNVEPLQPNFSMNGRSPDALLNHVERWHRQLGKEKKGSRAKQWERRKDISDFSIKFGTPGKGNFRVYYIRELVSHAELSSEGRAMGNCVASYSYSCVNGGTSIWSMIRENNMGTKHLATIEVNKDRNITQAKGPRNARLGKLAGDILNRWASKEKMMVSSYIR